MDLNNVAMVRNMLMNNMLMQLSQINQRYQTTLLRRRRRFYNSLLTIQNRDEESCDRKYHQIRANAIGLHIIPLGNMLYNVRPRSANKVRSNHFWEVIVQNHFDDNERLANFRMKKITFEQLCNQLRPQLEPSVDSLQIPLSVEKKVAMTLYKLSSCCEYRVVGNQFGVSKVTVHTTFYSVVRAINAVLVPELVIMPNVAEAEEIANVFETKYKFPQVLGAIDGTHIPILPPSDGYRDYINRKGSLIILQAVVDHRFRFRNIYCNFPGSCHDARVLKASSIYNDPKRIIPNASKVIDGVNVPLLILGDPAYPLLNWLIKGYTQHRELTPEEESFNVYLSSARMCVEIAFGRLKARWRCLSKRIDISHKFVPQVVAAACALHNFVEDNKEFFVGQWLDSVTQASIDFPQPAHQVVRGNHNHGMGEIRDHLKDYLATYLPLCHSTF